MIARKACFSDIETESTESAAQYFSFRALGKFSNPPLSNGCLFLGSSIGTFGTFGESLNLSNQLQLL